MRPDNAFKPKPLRSAKYLANTARHVPGSTMRLGLTRALGVRRSTGDRAVSYKREFQCYATPEAVFNAIATPVGIAGWWAKSNRIWRKDGNQFLSVDFGRVKKLLRVEESIAPSRLTWRVVECSLHEWPGTRIKFHIEPALGGSLLHLEHEGLVPNLECYGSCSAGWTYFMSSLKLYVETGHGTPQ